ncbi:MAG: hypothetical protein NZ942_03420 [Candidatus Aenigmarchaeota archaeon]|nr:hypothetical protein [Candidatus Aenigmarchaeota archaeon]
MGTNINAMNRTTNRYSRAQEAKDLKEIEIIGKILSESWKTKIFIKVCKMGLQDRRLGISGYKLARLTGKYVSVVYNFLYEMESEGIFEFVDKINYVKKVRISNYGLQIYSKIEMILPNCYDFLI